VPWLDHRPWIFVGFLSGDERGAESDDWRVGRDPHQRGGQLVRGTRAGSGGRAVQVGLRELPGGKEGVRPSGGEAEGEAIHRLRWPMRGSGMALEAALGVCAYWRADGGQKH